MGPVLDGRAGSSVYFWSLRSFLPSTRLGWQGPCTVVEPRGPAMKQSLEEKVLSPCIQAQEVCLFLIPALALGCGPHVIDPLPFFQGPAAQRTTVLGFLYRVRATSSRQLVPSTSIKRKRCVQEAQV